MQKKRRQKDRRSEPRFDARMWVGIPEAEGEADIEHCNISAAGMLLHTPRDAGEPGAVRMLRLVSGDLVASIEVMAHVIRVETRQDPDRGRVRVATAFEFLPHQPKELDAFLGIVLEGDFSVPIPDRRDAIPTDDSAEVAQADPIEPLQVSRIAFDTNRAVEVGTQIWLEIETPGGENERLSGSCTKSLPLDGPANEKLYSVEVQLDSPDSSHAASDSDIAGSPKGRQREGVHLSGSLSEVAIMSLLGFLDLERSSGVLSVQHESKKAAIFVSEGSVFDVDCEPAGESALESLTSLLGWLEGDFEFSFQSVDRADAIGMTTTSLLLECARLLDEDSRFQ